MGGGGHVLNNDCAFQNDASYEIGMPSEVSFTVPFSRNRISLLYM